ncbi:MAG: DUF1338 domain-containing protein [Flavobacteriaceae bacterium]|nr:DUF1338 domain-containing protein [Flavobacteriaceae bacterium]
MITTDNTILDKILDQLFTPYRERVPDVQKISNAMIAEGIINDEEEVVNDHIAFRTLGVPNLGIASFEKIFLHHGYTRRDYHNFPGKKLNAYWYSPPSEEYPRIFISELRVQELSTAAQEIIEDHTAHIHTDPVDLLNLDDPIAVGDFFHKPLWELPTLQEYNTLAEESEYAAWVIYNRYYLNHYTLRVHEFGEEYNTVEKFNQFLEGIGIKLNTAGGKVKVSEDGLLKQSSTVAKMIEAEFRGVESQPIPGSYVEFAERLVLPEYRHLAADQLERRHRREGFESANADKIFESTYREQTGR